MWRTLTQLKSISVGHLCFAQQRKSCQCWCGSPADYAVVLDELSANGWSDLRNTAVRFSVTQRLMTPWLQSISPAQVGESKPEKNSLTYDLKQAMRYGENPQQDAVSKKTANRLFDLLQPNSSMGKNCHSTISVTLMRRIIRILRPSNRCVSIHGAMWIGRADDIETAPGLRLWVWPGVYLWWYRCFLTVRWMLRQLKKMRRFPWNHHRTKPWGAVFDQQKRKLCASLPCHLMLKRLAKVEAEYTEL